MMILEVFLVFLLPGDCACAHVRADPLTLGAPRVSAWLPRLLSGDSYSKHWGKFILVKFIPRARPPSICPVYVEKRQ